MKGKDSRGDNLVGYSDGGAHCFSCGHHVFPSSYNLFRQKEAIEHVDTRVFPADFTRVVDPEGWKWLLQYGLSYSYWKDKVGYSPKSNRLVFPVPGTNPVFSIGRLLHEPTKKDRKWYVWGDCHTHAELVGSGRSCTVLVEDIVSAHKVGQLCETIPLFGTEVHPAVLYALRDGGSRPVVMWLDKDQEGAVAKKATRINLLTGRPVYLVHTHKDPKALALGEIEDVLREWL